VAQAQPAASAEHQAAPEHPSPQQAARTDNPLPNIRHIIAVGAGKGGVGKSTVAVALAVGLARRGAQVGLLDGDIYGPSTPTLLGLEHERPMGTKDILFPFSVHGIKTITIGKLVDPDKPLIWRGPMAHSAFRQLATQTDWGELDYLIVDLPPGTGDVPLTMAQLLPLRGAIIVCTPQKVARDDARRAVRMFEQLDVPVLGVVENMSYFIGDDGKEYDIFGRGGAETMAEQMDLTLLGSIPIHMELRQAGDTGEPLRNFEGNEKLAAELNQFVENVALKAEQDAAAEGGGRPTLSIS
jgi:ATP-binding protein involved in chromosome partitioning